MNRPEVGEHFIDGEGRECVMGEHGTYTILKPFIVRNMYYIDNNPEYSRQAKGGTEMKAQPELDSQFIYGLNNGHDTTKGLKELEAAYIEHVYGLARYNQVRAAKMLGLSRGCLRMKLKEYFGNKYV